jgi:hypothetical protein
MRDREDEAPTLPRRPRRTQVPSQHQASTRYSRTSSRQVSSEMGRYRMRMLNFGLIVAAVVIVNTCDGRVRQDARTRHLACSDTLWWTCVVAEILLKSDGPPAASPLTASKTAPAA